MAFGIIRVRLTVGSFSLKEKDRMRGRNRVYLFGLPHPSPLPEGERILRPHAESGTERYWGKSRKEAQSLVYDLPPTCVP